VAAKVLFLIFAALAVIGGLGTITRRNIVHGLLFLVFTFLNVAAIFFLSQAYFLAVVQILVYAGAIMVLFVFVVMFLNLRTFQFEEQTHRRQRWVALGLSVLALVEFIAVLAGMTFTSARAGLSPEVVEQTGSPTRVFAWSLFERTLLPFEIASVVLLVAMVGAILLVKKEKGRDVAIQAWDPGEAAPADSIEEEV
jgi:NADH-quinone oxidoreductase subunit J